MSLHKIPRITPRLLVIALGPALIVALLVFQTVRGGEPPAGSADEPLPPIPLLDVYDELPPEKQIYVDRMLEAYQRYLEGPGPAQVQRPRPTPREITFGTGIIEKGLAPFSSMSYWFANQWGGEVDGADVGVYAGAFVRDPSQGVVMVLVTILDPTRTRVVDTHSEQYLTPVKAGSVRIIAEDGHLLTMRAERGDTFVFDVTGGGFIEGPSPLAGEAFDVPLSPP